MHDWWPVDDFTGGSIQSNVGVPYAAVGHILYGGTELVTKRRVHVASFGHLTRRNMLSGRMPPGSTYTTLWSWRYAPL